MKINSSNIAETNYNAQDGTLTITFHSGKTYNYYGIDEKLYLSFIQAKSKGGFFADKIKNKFAYHIDNGYKF